MEPSEMKNVFQIVKERFPASTDNDVMQCWSMVSGLKFADVAQAARDLSIASKDKRVDPERLAAAARRIGQQVQERAKTIVESIRGMHGNEPRFKAMSDRQAIESHFVESWRLTDSQEFPDFARQRVRAAIYRHAVAAFTSIGMTDADADAAARKCVGLKMGEAMFAKPAATETPCEAVA